MKDPMVQKRGAIGDGGESDIPPALTQCFSKSTRDFVLNAARKPWVTAMMASVSLHGSGRDIPEKMGAGNIQHIGDSCMKLKEGLKIDIQYITPK